MTMAAPSFRDLTGAHRTPAQRHARLRNLLRVSFILCCLSSLFPATTQAAPAGAYLHFPSASSLWGSTSAMLAQGQRSIDEQHTARVSQLATNARESARKAAFLNNWARAGYIANAAAGVTRTSSWELDAIAGYAFLRSGDWSHAQHNLERALMNMPSVTEVRPHIVSWLVESSFHTENYELAIALASAIESRDLPVSTAIRIEYLAARAEVRLCENADSPRRLRSLLARYPTYPRVASARVEYASCLQKLGRTDLAASEIEVLHRERPWLPVVQAALESFEQTSGRDARATSTMNADERLEWLRDLRHSRHWNLAETEFARFADELDLSSLTIAQRNRFWFQRGLNAYESASFERALDHFDQVTPSRDGVSRWLVTKFRALALSRIGQQQEAYALVDEDCTWVPRAECPELRFEFAWDFGLYELAKDLIDSGRSPTPDARKLAFLQFLLGDFDVSAGLFGQIAGTSDGHGRLAALYWQARSLEEAGNGPAAKAILEEVAEARPFDFYALLSQGKLRELRQTSDEPTNQDDEAGVGTTPSDEAGVAASSPTRDTPESGENSGAEKLTDSFVLDWGASSGANGNVPTIDVRSDDRLRALEQFTSRWGFLFPEAKTAHQLAELGALEEARLTLREAFRELEWRKQTTPGNRASKPWTLSSFRIDRRRVGSHGWYGLPLSFESVTAATRSEEELSTLASDFSDIIADASDAADAVDDCFMVRQFLDIDGRLNGPVDDDGTIEQWRRFHCRPFEAQIRSLALQYEIPAELLYALILTESSANPDSISHADAYGLMQVIPRTGTKIALGYGEQDFGVEQLLDPRESVAFGTWYLSELLKRFNGQEPLALVAYNAGPHQVARWLDWRGEMMDGDVFFETIPFDGSRNYAKKIIRLAVTYHYLMTGDEEFALSSSLDPDDGDNIYY